MEQFPREAICDWAGTTPEIVALYVCGSHVQGTARSDLDLAVEVEGGSFGLVVKFVLSRVRWIEDLRAMTGILVKDLELIDVSKSVKDPVEIYRRYAPPAETLAA
jgi:predicted nucleotidyltransferase